MRIDLELERKKLDREITFFHFKRAAKKIFKCIKLSIIYKDEFFLNYFRAQEQILEGNYHDAIKFLDKALVLNDLDGCAYNDKALSFAELGKNREAMDCFNQGITKDVGCASLYHNKGWLLNSLNQHKQAIVCFHKALELDPDRPETLYSLADSHYQLRDKKSAFLYFQKAFHEVENKSSYVKANIRIRLKNLER